MESALNIALDRQSLLLQAPGGSTWRSDPPLAIVRSGGDDWKPGRRLRGAKTELEKTDRGLRAEVTAEESALRIPIEIRPGAEAVELEVGPAEALGDADSLELVFPNRLGYQYAGEKGYIVLPIGMGALCDFSPRRRDTVLERHIYSGGQTGFTMPTVGIVAAGRGLGCIVDTPFDCKLRAELNHGTRSLYAFSLVWRFDSRTNYPRKAHYFPISGYVELAKRYRSELIRSGRYASLREKTRSDPEVAQLAGALLGHRRLSVEGEDSSQTSAYAFFKRCLEQGFDRVVVHNVWRGRLDDIKKANQYAKSLSPGFRLSVYENFVDTIRPEEYPEKEGRAPLPRFDESILLRMRDLSPRPNWRIRRKGQPDVWTLTVCPSKRLEVARPELMEMRRVLGRGSIYIDVEGALPLLDCFDPRHPVTKSQDASNRIRLLREVKKLFGVVTTESLPQDFLCGTIDVGSYFSVFPHSGFGNSEFRIMPPLIPVPLHPLVWHGSILNQTATGTTFYQSDPPHAALYGWLADTLDDKGRRISYKLRDAAFEEMVSHEFLTGPRVVVGPDDAFHCDDVQLSKFSDGTVVVANFSSLPYTWGSAKIPPMDFLIYNERLALKTSCIRREQTGEVLISILVENTWDLGIPASELEIMARGAWFSTSPVMGRIWMVSRISIPMDPPWAVTDIAECGPA